MGSEDSKEEYKREEIIKNKEEKIKNLDKGREEMWNDPFFSFEECIYAGRAKDIMTNEVNSLKQMDKAEKNFSKNINLDDYRNDDGTFNIYKAERPLDNKYGENSNKMSKSFHHEGIGIGNGTKILFSDYGVNEGNLAVRFWDSKENKDKWKDVKEVGKSNASDNDINNIFFGPKSEKWTNPHNYNLFFHNCQDYSKEKIKDLEKI